MRIIPRLNCMAFAAVAAVAIALTVGNATRLDGRATSSGPEAEAHNLRPLVTNFHKYGEDFLGMASARKGDPEFEILMYLHNNAQSVEDHLGADHLMISMYDDVECGADRARIRHYISEHFGYELKFIDFHMGNVNTAVANTMIPAAGQLGLEMKNDLRSAKEKLERIVTSLE
jgi:hypothetical protein